MAPQLQNQGLIYNQPVYNSHQGNGQPYMQQPYVSPPLMPQYNQPYPQPQAYAAQNLGFSFNQPNTVYNNQQGNNLYQSFQPNSNINLNPLNLNPINTSNFGALNKQITLDTKNEPDNAFLTTNQPKSNVKNI